jgi:hypothetical protein
MGEWLTRQTDNPGARGMDVVWRADRLYIMNNHRAALWCWRQHDGQSQTWNLLHVDRHYDARDNQLKQLLPLVPRVDAPLEEYLAAFYVLNGSRLPVVDWDTYLAFFLATEADRLKEMCFATAGQDTRPQAGGVRELSPWQLLDQLADLGGASEAPWIVNLDLDYFTGYRLGTHSLVQVFTPDFVRQVGGAIGDGLKDGSIGVATVATSPETTGMHLVEPLLEWLSESWKDRPPMEAGRLTRG